MLMLLGALPESFKDCARGTLFAAIACAFFIFHRDLTDDFVFAIYISHTLQEHI